MQLVGAKLQSIAEDLRADGWKWITVQPEIDRSFVNRHRRISAPLFPWTAEAQAELQALEQERDVLAERFDQEFGDENGSEEESGGDTLQDQIGAIEDRIGALHASRERDYSDAVKASCGVVIGVGQSGQPEIIYGLLTKEDEVKLIQAEENNEAAAPALAVDDDKEETPAYSAALIESLRQHKTAAIAVELSQRPTVALAALVHSLVLNEFGLDLHLYGAKSSLQISSHQANLAGATDSPALALLDQKKLDWTRQFPTAPAALWSWCLAQPQDVLLELLAYCVARTVHGVQSKADNRAARLQHADALAGALDCDMSKWFTATAENFFLRVSKSKIADALTEPGKPVTIDGLKRKKAELAALAETEIAGIGWLPEPVRVSNRPAGQEEADDQPVGPLQNCVLLNRATSFSLLAARFCAPGKPQYYGPFEIERLESQETIIRMQEYSVFSADCLCGRHFETQSRDYVCAGCGREIFLEWGRESITELDNIQTPEYLADVRV
jgi:ParB family transcriptional regulator, chromosome partitioning protein